MQQRTSRQLQSTFALSRAERKRGEDEKYRRMTPTEIMISDDTREKDSVYVGYSYRRAQPRSSPSA